MNIKEKIKEEIKKLNADELEKFMKRAKETGYPKEILDDIINDVLEEDDEKLFSQQEVEKRIKEEIENLNPDELKEFMRRAKEMGYPEEMLDNILDNNINQLKEIKEKIFNEPQELSNNYDFNFQDVSEEDIIRGAIESDVPVFLHGKSGDGKSARIKQIDNDPTIIYLRNATPESLNGRSVYDSKNGEIKDIKPSWLKKIEKKCEEEQDKLHVLFFDELSNALPSLQGMAFNIVLDKEVNGIWKLPDNVRIVAAGNDMDESLAANQIAEPLFNRFAHVYIETTTENWLNWAIKNNIHPAIYYYIAYTHGSSLRTEFTGEEPNADPRKWELASKMLYATKNPEMIRSLVGEEITDEFVEFCNKKVVTIDDIITGRYKRYNLNMSLDEKYLTAAGLSWVDEKNYDKVRAFVDEYLGQEICTVFDTFWAHDDETRLEKVAKARLKNKVYHL